MTKRRVVDTNILIRLLTKDDLAQYQKAYALFQNEYIFFKPNNPERSCTQYIL